MKNRYIIQGDIIVVYLRLKNKSFKETKVSFSKLEKLLSFPGTWCAAYDKKNDRFYAKASRPGGKGAKTDLSIFLTDAPKGTIVDHFNHDTLDNTDDNLKVVNKSLNRLNSEGLDTTNTSGYKGVWFHKKNKKWMAEITVDGIKINLGSHSDIKDAVKARKDKEKEVLG